MSIPVPHTAMVLAAGLGTRMRPLTDHMPKPLIKVSGKCLIDRIVDPLVAAGVKRLVVNVHWCADAIESHVAKWPDIEVVISDERELLLETGGALAKTAGILGDEPVFVANTDAFWGSGEPSPLLAMADVFDPDRMDELLLLADRDRALGFSGPGDFFIEDGTVLKRRGDAPSAPWAYAGLRILKPQAFLELPVEPFSVAWRVWGPLVENGRLHGYPLDDFWLHVGDPSALKDAEMWTLCHGA